jgi:hypothetical protein
MFRSRCIRATAGFSERPWPHRSSRLHRASGLPGIVIRAAGRSSPGRWGGGKRSLHEVVRVVLAL